MKKTLYLSLFALFFFAMFSCKEVNNAGKSRILEDSMVKVFPTYRALHVELNDDETEITVVIGDPQFYQASTEEKNNKAEELGKLIARIYGTENYINKGTLIATKDINNTSNAPADGVATPIDLARIKKEVHPN